MAAGTTSELVAFGRLEPMLPEDEPWLVLDLLRAELTSMIQVHLSLGTAKWDRHLKSKHGIYSISNHLHENSGSSKFELLICASGNLGSSNFELPGFAKQRTFQKHGSSKFELLKI